MRNFSIIEKLRIYSSVSIIEELSIISNSYAVVSKGGGRVLVLLFIREAEGKI